MTLTCRIAKLVISPRNNVSTMVMSNYQRCSTSSNELDPVIQTMVREGGGSLRGLIDIKGSEDEDIYPHGDEPCSEGAVE